MSTYKSFDENYCMYFMIKEENFFDKYNETWEKISNLAKVILKAYLYTIKNTKKLKKKNQHK